jgi:hypothetical protein
MFVGIEPNLLGLMLTLSVTKNCRAGSFLLRRLMRTLKGPEILEESIDQDSPYHQQAHPNNCLMDEYGLEGDHTGQAFWSPLEA